MNGSNSLLVLSSAMFLITQSASAQSTGYTGLFGGGPFYKNAAANITQVENSGFTEVIVWSVEVSSTGDLNFNGEFPLTSGGFYVGNQTWPDFPADMAQLKQGTVKRITFSIGSSNYGDWENIKALVDAQGTGPTSILYQDIVALKTAIPALDAIDFDDENSFDEPSTVAFGVMLGKLGLKAIPDPFDNNSYWESVVAQINGRLAGTVDGVHLQAYAGGTGNNPCVDWNFGGVPVWPGLWDQVDTPSQVQSIMTGWNSECGINGGFLWLYDDIVGSSLVNQYAAAINTAVSSTGFLLSGPSNIYLNQSGVAGGAIKITDLNGFSGDITFTVSGLPTGVQGGVGGTGNERKLLFQAGPLAATGFSTITVTGTSGSITQTFFVTLAVSAATGSTGKGVVVDLSSYFNRNGIYTDGTMFPASGGLDGVGNAYSANLLGTSRVDYEDLFDFGPANELDAVSCTGQTVALTAGRFSNLLMLGAGVEGDQMSQTVTVTYTDGTTTRFSQNFSDWYTPASYPDEKEAVAMAYRDESSGTKDDRKFNLYSYQFTLDSSKVVKSVTLPNDADVVILAATLR
ncbi:hypothetical protein [Nevskia soli]|uniref:hypothetical protein n=1 Tax=Nevskia soli TaxID=418856 RepID=UPI0015D91759|nr:hypothetical protein [Nevskia soli]